MTLTFWKQLITLVSSLGRKRSTFKLNLRCYRRFMYLNFKLDSSLSTSLISFHLYLFELFATQRQPAWQRFRNILVDPRRIPQLKVIPIQEKSDKTYSNHLWAHRCHQILNGQVVYWILFFDRNWHWHRLFFHEIFLYS